jgi:hypothetical protein
MNISPISSNTYNSSFVLNTNNEIKMLEKQKEQLQDQIKKINESDMADKIKQENIKLLKDQIQQIESLIQQKRSEKLTQNMNKDASNSDNGAKTTSKKGGNSGSGDDSSGMTDLIAANSTVSKARIQSGVKNSLESEGRILKKEIELDEARSLSGCTAVRKREQLQEMETRGLTLEDKIADTLKTAQENTEAPKESDDGLEPAGEADAAAEDASQKDDPRENNPQENDPLSWLLENGDKYKKVDTLA